MIRNCLLGHAQAFCNPVLGDADGCGKKKDSRRKFRPTSNSKLFQNLCSLLPLWKIGCQAISARTSPFTWGFQLFRVLPSLTYFAIFCHISTFCKLILWVCRANLSEYLGIFLRWEYGMFFAFSWSRIGIPWDSIHFFHPCHKRCDGLDPRKGISLKGVFNGSYC